MKKNPITTVVAGIVFNHAGEILLSSRPADKSYAGYWEFAGGKVNPNESLFHALQREFDEELGIQIHQATLWQEKIHHYEHVSVHLHFFIVQADEWSGEPQAREQQEWAWQNPRHLTVAPMLPANEDLLNEINNQIINQINPLS